MSIDNIANIGLVEEVSVVAFKCCCQFGVWPSLRGCRQSLGCSGGHLV